MGLGFQLCCREHLAEVCVVEIELGENDRLDWALKQFRRRMIRSGIFKDMRRKRFYEKPARRRKPSRRQRCAAATRTANSPGGNLSSNRVVGDSNKKRHPVWVPFWLVVV
jgi:small subunit ribosomal protein S21